MSTLDYMKYMLDVRDKIRKTHFDVQICFVEIIDAAAKSIAAATYVTYVRLEAHTGIYLAMRASMLEPYMPQYSMLINELEKLSHEINQSGIR